MFEIGRIHFLMNPGLKRRLVNAIYLEHIAMKLLKGPRVHDDGVIGKPHR
jgi:hypothetical protein